MTAEQSLVGAMGCASWRAHQSVREYSDVAPAGGIIREGSSRRAPTVGPPDVLGLNEVGVTDSVMVTIWRSGPRAAAFAVSPLAEANHLGADIAVVHSATRRMLLYQAKLARLEDDLFELKSRVTSRQIRLLRRRSVTLDGIKHSVTGRLALYQADDTPFIQQCDHLYWPGWWPVSVWSDRWRWWQRSEDKPSHQPQLGQRYYEDFLAEGGCSPSGILAAPVVGDNVIRGVWAPSTWPWEFDIYEWLYQGASPLDMPRGPAGQYEFAQRIPEFVPYVPTRAERAQDADAAALATVQQLVSQLRLPARRRLYLIRL